TSIELLPRPPQERDPSTPWPLWPLVYRSSSSHEEGGVRAFAIATRRFSGAGGRVTKLHAVRLEFGPPDRVTGRRAMREIPGSEFEIPADLVLLAMGFLHPVHAGLVEGLGLRLDARGNLAADARSFATSAPGVFAAGACRRGQWLVAWATWEGREAARAVDAYLMRSWHLQARAAFV